MPSDNLLGKIESVVCKNFVTYEECIFRPNQYLNVIIGPNGTGKSTIVAAIIIGLGGDPKLLNRATAIQEYVKNGKNSASVIIQIYKDNRGNVARFERNFNSSGKSEFKVNGATMSKTKYIAEVATFKIQIGNLCQFLPQDRVHDFAKMNKEELFENTVKSVCDQSDIEKYEQLKKLREEQSTGKDKLAQNMQHLRNITQRVEELKIVLERHTERTELIDKIKICVAKKNWLEVSAIEEKQEGQKRDKIEAEKLLKKTETKYNTVKRKQDGIEKTNLRLKTDASRKDITAKTSQDNVDAIANEIEKHFTMIKAAKRHFDMSKREMSKSISELNNEIALSEGLEQDLKNVLKKCGSIQDCKEQQHEVDARMQEIKDQIKNRMNKILHINTKLDEEYLGPAQMLKGRIERANNVKDQKLQLLRSKFPKVFTAVQWLEENQHIFRGKIYLPMLLELNIKESQYAKYAENTISFRDLLAFTCEHKSDLSLLVDELCVKQKLGISALHSPPARTCEYRCNVPIQNLSQYGFTAYLIDLIEGPASILNYLCSAYNLHQLPIGSEKVSQCTDQIPTNIRVYFGGDLRYSSTVSKYNKSVSLMQSPIGSKQLLHSIDKNLVERMKSDLIKLQREMDKLKNERSGLESEIREIEVSCEELRSEKRTIESKQLQIRQSMQKNEMQKQKVNRLKNNLIDPADAEQTYRVKVADGIKNILGEQKKRMNALSSYEKSVFEKKAAQDKIRIYNQQSEDLTMELREVTEQKISAGRTLENIQSAIMRLGKHYADKIAQAKSTTNNYAPKDRNFPFKKQFAELPNALEQLREIANEHNARLECMTDVDEGIVAEYEQKTAEIEEIKQSIYDIQTSESTLQARIDAIFEHWQSMIQNIIATLNQQFSEFMASMKFVGEISLTRQDIHDFDSYGIQILVQYRKEVPLQALDRYTQSGGERAVAIAIYSLSLQHITHVPFRCVDEINQGMDSTNERKIFEMLVQETTKNNRSQYFFVTPKLLPNLMCNNRMMVHIVSNGKFVKTTV